MSSNVEGKRLAGAHLIFNAATGFIAIAGITWIMELVDWMSSSMGIAAADYTLKLAVFHTVFNSLGIIVMAPFVPKLVRGLERWMPTPAPEFERPVYLNEASIDFADAAIEAARNETVRLYEKAIELIVHGMGLRRRDVFSEEPPEPQEWAGAGWFEDRIQERYEQSIKSIYASLLEFISRARVGMERKDAEEALAIRMAGRDLIEAVKGVKHLQKNLKRRIHSQTPDIRAAYEEIRQRIGHVLREIDTVRRSGEDRLAILSLNETKVAVKRQDVLASGKLDDLVRGNRISPMAATSLINDNGYAYEICKNLIESGQILFAVHDEDLREAQRSLALDEDEIEVIADSGVIQ
jgi:phosphate:Na+ symporter